LQEEVIESTISLDEQLLISQLPYVIAYPFKRMLEEPDGRNKLELLAYTFLNGLKYLGLVIASEYFNSPLKSAKINEQFRNNLFQPSFGNWNTFLREAIICLDSQNQPLIFPEIKEIYKKLELAKSAKKYKTESQYTDENGLVAWKKSELTAIGILINFRNRYLGHGVPLSKEEYESLFKVISPVLIDFLSEWKAIEHITMFRSEAKESWQMMGAEISLISNNSPNKKSNVYLSHLDGRNLELIPFYVLPKQFSAGASDKAQIQVYEQNTGQRVIFYSPESIKSEASGEILERFKILLEEKEQEEYFTTDQFSIEILQNQLQIYKLKTRTGLIKEKKLLEGIYQSRLDAETELMSWISAKAGLFILAAEAGSGKTNLLSHMVNKYENTGFNAILIRAIRTNGADIEKEIKELLNVNNQFDLPTFISNHFTQENPLIILIDGGNEHQEPTVFLKSILQFVSKTTLGSLKVVLSWRISTLNDLPLIDKNYDSILYEIGGSNDESKDAYKAFLLKGLNKIEIEGAWDFYKGHSSKLYRPNFSFKDLLAFDSLLVDELSNPLLLRLFMELYSGKPLPMASEGFINLWELWWKQLQKNVEESRYLVELASYMISKNSLQVSLDELFDVPQLSDAVKNIQIDSPHQQLIRKGILSQFFQHNTLQVSFTMEASFHYVVSKNLNLDLALKQLKNNSIWKESIKYFLWDKMANKDNLLLFELIDSEEFPNDLAALALSQRIILFGAKETIRQLFIKESDDDWNVVKRAFAIIKERRPKLTLDFADQVLGLKNLSINDVNRLFVIELLSETTKFNADIFYKTNISVQFLGVVEELIALARYFMKYEKPKEALVLYEKVINILEEENYLLGGIFEDMIICQKKLLDFTRAYKYINQAEKFYKSKFMFSSKIEGRILNFRGEVKEIEGFYKEALIYFQNAFEVNKTNLGPFHHESIKNQINLGDIYNHLGEFNLSLLEYEKALSLNIQVFGEMHPNIAVCLNRIGEIYNLKGEFQKALDSFKKSLKINSIFYDESYPNAAICYSYIGDVLGSKGEYDNALEYNQKALAINLQYYGESHPNTANSYFRIGDLLDVKGEYDNSLEFYQKSLAIHLQYYGESHPNTASSYIRIGDLLDTKGEYDNSLEYHQKALAINLQYYGESHPNTASSYIEIGDSIVKKGEYDKALEYYQKSLAINLQYYGESHPNTAKSYDKIGDLLDTKGEYDNSLEFYQKSLAIHLQYYGESHPHTANSYFRIGDLLHAKGEYDNSLEYHQKALAIKLQYYGESHPNTASSYNRKGASLDTKGEYDKALEFYQKSLDIALNCYGKSHPNTASSYILIGDLLDTKGEYDKALEYYQKSLAINLQYYGESHPNTADNYNRIGASLDTKGEYDKALECYQKSLAINLQYYGESHPNTAKSYDKIGDLLDTKGEYDNSLECYQKSLAINLQYYGESHPNTAKSYDQIGDLLDRKGEYDKALEYYQKALAIDLQCYGEIHPNTANSYDRIGDLLNTKGEYDNSLECYQKSLAIHLQYHGESHPNTAHSYNRIGDWLKTKGEYDNAIVYHQKALTIYLQYYGESHPNTAFSYSFIGDIYEANGDYLHAHYNYTTSLGILENYFGENHPNIASLKRNVGKALTGLGDLNKAKEMLEASVAIFLQIQVESNPKLARTYLILAKCLRLLKNSKTAQEIIEKAIEIIEKNFGDSHVESANAYFEKGCLLVDMDNLIEAQVYFKKCYDVRLTILGPEHVDTVEVQEKLII
jgi:tetratricopeptide (TPR) repeat protein